MEVYHNKSITMNEEPSGKLVSLKIKNLNYAICDEALQQAFSRFGEIAECYISKHPVTRASRGFGFVSYYRTSAALEAAFYMNRKVLCGRAIEVQLTDRELKKSLASQVRRSFSESSDSSDETTTKSTAIKIENLAYTATDEDLKLEFKRCGPIADIYIPKVCRTKLNRGYAFVKFFRRSDATYAIEHYDRIKIKGRRIRISEAKYGKPPSSHRYVNGSPSKV